MNNYDKIAVVIPAKDEEEGIGEVIDTFSKPLISKVIVIDGSSTDRTVEIAKSKGAVLINASCKGKGADFRFFLDKGHFDSEIYLMIDGDGTYNGKEAKDLVQPILDGDADVVMGYRFGGEHNGIEDGAMSSINLFGNKCLTFVAKTLYGRPDLKDLCTGYWAFSKSFFEKAQINAKGFDLEANLFTEALKNGFQIKHVPITYSKRLGQGTLAIHDGFSILWRLLRERL